MLDGSDSESNADELSILAALNFDWKNAAGETFREFQNKDYIGMNILLKNYECELVSGILQIC